MSNLEQVIGSTRSICPVCAKQLPAKRVRQGEEIFLQKTCPEHGGFSTVIWRGPIDLAAWRGDLPAIAEGENLHCPTNCGICADHQQGTCCTLYEVTRRCNLRCSFCFAEGGEGEDIPLPKIKQDIAALVKPGQTLLQLSGGEPSCRDDLPQIIAYAKQVGTKYVQLNSNGIRLGKDEQFVAACAKAGLSFVFMQFDGTTDDIYQQLRNAPLLEIKKQAIANCAKHNIGVTLVPTLVPGCNTADIGNILRFAISHAPAVRGVHFQPVSYFGRYPAPPANADRYTLGELIMDIEQQTGGLIKAERLTPSHCDHPLCGLHSSFIVRADGRLTPLGKTGGSCCGEATAEQNREYIGKRWQRPDADACCGEPEDEFEQFLLDAKMRAFTVTAMAFQDAYNLDIERLRRCSLHVYQEGKFIPFCARYLSLRG